MKLQSAESCDSLRGAEGAHATRLPWLGYPIIGDSAPKLAGIWGTVHITFPRWNKSLQSTRR